MKASFSKINGYEWVEFDEGLITVYEELKKTAKQIYDGQCEEIYGPNQLDYIDSKHISSFLIELCSKLQHGGKLIVGGTDIIELTKNILNYTLNNETANQLIYSKNGLHSLNLVTNILLENNMRIVKKQINGLSLLVEAIRP